MYYILSAAIALIFGSVLGYFYSKSKYQKHLIENDLLKKQIAERQSLKEETRAAVFEVSQQISSKLLEDHKRENQESKKQTEEVAQNIRKEFSQVIEKLAAINGQVEKQDNKVGTLWKALASPSAAGQFAEIGLENTLAGFDLVKDRDFFTQFSVNHEGARLRPDALVKLPEGNLMVIDAKSSKFFLEIAADENDEKQLLEKLKTTMITHLNDLSSKEYQNAVRQITKQENATILSVMYVASHSFLNKILAADNGFYEKCSKKGILLADPTALQLLLHISTQQIARQKREENFQQILKEIGKVVSSVDVLLRGVEKVGASLKSTAKAFAELAKPVNSRLLPRLRKVIELGVEPENQAKLPQSVPTVSIIENEPEMLEIEVDEKVTLLEKRAG